MLDGLGFEMPARIEILPGEPLHLIVAGAPDTQAHFPFVTVRQIYRGVGWQIRHRLFAVEFQLYGFEMFAGAELRCLEIHTGAVVPTAVFATEHHLVLLFANGVGYAVFAIAEIWVHSLDAKLFLFRGLSAQRAMPLLKSHIFGLYYVVQTSFRCLFRCSCLIVGLGIALAIVVCHVGCRIVDGCVKTEVWCRNSGIIFSCRSSFCIFCRYRMGKGRCDRFFPLYGQTASRQIQRRGCSIPHQRIFGNRN